MHDRPTREQKARHTLLTITAVVVIVVLVLVTARACAASGEKALLWTLDGAEYTGGETAQPTVWATGQLLAVARARDVTGYDAATGERRWSVPLGDMVCAVSSRPDGGRVAVQYGETALGCHRVAMIDLATGEKVWEQTISPTDRYKTGRIVIGADTVVIDWRYGTAAFRPADGRPVWTIDSRGRDCAIEDLAGGPVLLALRTCGDEVHTVHRLDPRDGRSLWSHAVPPGTEVAAMATTGPVVLGLSGAGRGVTRFAVLSRSGAPVTTIDIADETGVRCYGAMDLARCLNVVLSADSLYVRPQPTTGPGKPEVPIVSHDLADGSARWSTENPDGRRLHPVAMDGDRLIAVQPSRRVRSSRGGGTTKPPRLVSVDAATGEASVEWDLSRDVSRWLGTRYGRRYEQGRLFVGKGSVTDSGFDDVVFRAFAAPPE